MREGKGQAMTPETTPLSSAQVAAIRKHDMKMIGADDIGEIAAEYVALCDSHERLRASLVAMTEERDALQRERDEYRTLSRIGRWHSECRPNRVQAAREFEKLQATIDKMADAVSESNRRAEAAEQERDALRRQVAWQPMETAPKDGTSVLLLHPVSFLGSITVGWFTAGKWRDEATLNLEPTHWMPLPSTDTAQQEGK